MSEPKDVSPFELHNSIILANRDAEPIVFSQIVREMGLSGPTVPMVELVGQVITILRAKPFQSKYEGKKNPWFCVFLMEGDDQPYTTTIGGSACVEMLEAFAAAEIDRPFQVKIEWVEAGRHDGYYQFA